MQNKNIHSPTNGLNPAGGPVLHAKPNDATAVLVLEDGEIYWGIGAGVNGESIGEVCFNTSMTGYQEILTDPSYAGQIITFTFPHIGNVGTCIEDMESKMPAARGAIFREAITEPANWRATNHLNTWIKAQGLTALTGVDTRRLTRHIRDRGPKTGVLVFPENNTFDVAQILDRAKQWPGLKGMDLAQDVSCGAPYSWDRTEWQLGHGHGQLKSPKYHVVAVDFGAKHNILRCLASADCQVTVVPAATTADDILALNPDGVFLSNGPGDPAATGVYAVPMVQGILAANKPLFGICLGHQILALALGAKTIKMPMGHRGANQPVKDLETGKVEITSQNHGFVVDIDSLPDGVMATHTSLFDGVLQGLRVQGKPVFSVQYHPEASPGPMDSHYLFNRFINLMQDR